MREPLIHSHITDVLPDDDTLAFTTIYCKVCRCMVHAENNECMQTWIETGHGNYCLMCFVKESAAAVVLDEDWGLA